MVGNWLHVNLSLIRGSLKLVVSVKHLATVDRDKTDLLSVIGRLVGVLVPFFRP